MHLLKLIDHGEELKLSLSLYLATDCCLIKFGKVVREEEWIFHELVQEVIKKLTMHILRAVTYSMYVETHLRSISL